MGKMTRLATLLAVAAFGLAACDDDNNGGTAGDPQDQFGSVFADAFNATRLDTAIDPKPGDAGELSVTDDPVDF